MATRVICNTRFLCLQWLLLHVKWVQTPLDGISGLYLLFLVHFPLYWCLSGILGSSCSHIQIIATPRQDPGSCGSKPFLFHPLRLDCPPPTPMVFTDCKCMFRSHAFQSSYSQIEISSLFFLAYFINISQSSFIRPYLYIFLLEGDPLKAGIMSWVIVDFHLEDNREHTISF